MIGDAEGLRGRTFTLYRDDSTVQVIYTRVKAAFWTAGNSVLVISRYDADEGDGHHYIHWPRERFCWFKDQPETSMGNPIDPTLIGKPKP